MWGTHGELGGRAYNWDLGAEPQRGAGAEPLVRGQGAKPPVAKRFSALKCPNEAASLPFLRVFGA